MKEKVSVSQRIWGIDWKKHLPSICNGYSLEVSSYEEFCATRNRPESFLVTSETTNSNSFMKETNPTAKENYLREVSDFFVFKKDGEIVGVAVGDMLDWSTYYARFCFVAHAHRSHGLNNHYAQTLERVCVQYGVEKVCCDVSPANQGQVARMTQIGWMYTGSVLSERFGANLRLTKFLSRECQDVYNRNFTLVYKSEKQPREGMTPDLTNHREIA